jgi:hypothetical protein
METIETSNKTQPIGPWVAMTDDEGNAIVTHHGEIHHRLWPDDPAAKAGLSILAQQGGLTMVEAIKQARDLNRVTHRAHRKMELRRAADLQRRAAARMDRMVADNSTVVRFAGKVVRHG